MPGAQFLPGTRLLPLWRFWLVVVLFAFQFMLLALVEGFGYRCILFVFTFICGVQVYRSPDLDFLLYAATCRSLPGKGFVIRYKKRLAEEKTLQTYAEQCQREYDDLIQVFGFSPRRKVSIYLFGSPNEIARITGTYYDLQCEGNITVRLQAALPLYGCIKKDINAILATFHDDFQFLVRHEFAHFFARQIGPEAMSLNAEGLALWVEYKGRIHGLSDYTLGVLNQKKRLEAFLDDTLFAAPSTRYASYEIAGSFTTFLIERFGWAAYSGFYKDANYDNFLASFEKAFSMALADAEALWRETIRCGGSAVAS